MSEAELVMLSPDGMPDAVINIDILTARAHTAAVRLALAANTGQVKDAMAREVLGVDLPAHVIPLFANLVMHELAESIFGPLLTFARAHHPQHDFIGELRAHAGNFDPQQWLGGGTAAQDSPNGSATAAGTESL